RACWSGYSRRQYGPRTSLLSPIPHGPALSSCYLGQVSANANTTPLPSSAWGPGIVKKLSDLDAGLLKDSTWFRQPPLSLSSLFRDLFGDLPDGPFCRLFGGPPPPGRRSGLFSRLGSRFNGLARRFGGLLGGFCSLAGGLPGGSPRLLGRRRGFGFHRADGGQDPVNLPGNLLDGHHPVDRGQLPTLGIIVDQRLGHRAVARQPLRQHFRGIVDSHFLAARLHLGDARLDAVQKRALIDAQFDHGVELDVLLLQELIERGRLRHRARKAIEDETVLHVGLVETVGDDSDHDLIR